MKVAYLVAVEFVDVGRSNKLYHIFYINTHLTYIIQLKTPTIHIVAVFLHRVMNGVEAFCSCPSPKRPIMKSPNSPLRVRLHTNSLHSKRWLCNIFPSKTLNRKNNIVFDAFRPRLAQQPYRKTIVLYTRGGYIRVVNTKAGFEFNESHNNILFWTLWERTLLMARTNDKCGSFTCDFRVSTAAVIIRVF